MMNPIGIRYANGKQVLYYLDSQDVASNEIKTYSSKRMRKKDARLFLKVVNVEIDDILYLNTEDVMNLDVDINRNTNDKYPLRDKERFKLNSVWNSYLKESSLNKYCWDDISYVFKYKFKICDMPEDFLSENFLIDTETEYTTTYYDEATRKKFMVHTCPICGYKRKLELHITSEKGGKTVESPWPLNGNSVPFVPIEIDGNSFYVCYDCYQNFLSK